MDKKEYEAKRAQLLAEMKAAIDACDAVKASAAEKEIMELDEKFQALAKAKANFAALNGSQVPAAPAVPAALNTAPIAPVSNAKAEEDELYTQAFAHYMMGVKMSAEEQNIFGARNATSTVKENHVVVPTTLKQGIWTEMEELH
ncbi:MAG: phage major capsid protein, partial [Acidaminococcaceae bacterium]|nr:phage major capsid protein [Acidaminococcaceae bacterium]